MSWKDAYPDIPLGRDACGIIAMAEKSGKPSHRVVRRTLESLYRMAHRAGAIRGEGDGTGIQTDIPRELWALFLEQAGLDPGLAHNPRFFVGHFFVPKKEAGRLQEFEDLLRREGQRLGVRPVLFRRGEVVSEVLGPVGRRTEPLFLQVAGLSPDGDAPLWELGLRAGPASPCTWSPCPPTAWSTRCGGGGASQALLPRALPPRVQKPHRLGPQPLLHQHPLHL